MTTPRYTGARLAPTEAILAPMRTEDLARYRFFRDRARGPRILDLGCGFGEGTASLAEVEGWRVVGVDAEPDAVSVARAAAPTARFARMDGERLAFRDGVFDGIISIEVIEHVPDPHAYLCEAHRALAPGGLFLLTTPNRLRSSPTPGSLWPEHLREYSPDELRRLIASVFPDVELWGQHIPLYEAHPLRRAVRRLAPYVKPVLPRFLRVRALPMVQTAIRAEIALTDVEFRREDIDSLPTLVALCHKPLSRA